MTPRTHGGHRKGSGRKPSPNRTRKITIALPEDVIAELDRRKKSLNITTPALITRMILMTE